MLSDKEIKKEFRVKAQKDPNKHYPVQTLKELGFERKQCSKCKNFFWSTKEGDVCGEPVCSGGFRFIQKPIAKHQLDYIEVWKKFSKTFKNFGYTPIDRYPVVSRWHPNCEFTIASITNFQPYVVSGEVAPPANPLVVPQLCLRFKDVSNVGLTGHNVLFSMLGQHTFVPPEKYDFNKYLMEIYIWLDKGLGIPKDELTFHEDSWAGSSFFGPALEFFSGGLEIGNQVYMQYEHFGTSYKELKIKVLDMGEGQERTAWFSNAAPTPYEITFPTVCKKLQNLTNLKTNKELIKKFVPYAGFLNLDEVEDINKAWQQVANKVGIGVGELKETTQPLAALYSIGEHSRALLVAITDGALPSNVGGGYNLRAVLRRTLSLIDKYNWDIYLPEVCEWHAEYLKPMYPELREKLEEVKKILDVERSKYEATKQKTKMVISKIISTDITEKKLLELYDSQGISPELVKEEASKLGKKVEVPADFYSKVTELHEIKTQELATSKEEGLPLNNVQETEALYFDDYKKTVFKAKVLKIIGNKVILDKTAFYPTSGGQIHDIGTLNNCEVTDIFKQGAVIIHELKEIPTFKEGSDVEGKIDLKRRVQLAQHHTATHIINAATRRILGSHINQAGAKKTVEKASLDVTHYQSITEEEIEKIEKEANRIVTEKIPIYKTFMPRNEAEKKYGMKIYQGGAVPGKKLRIVEIPEIDVECCAGTHLNNTSEAGSIKILKTTKIQDGVCRITFTAGEVAKATSKEEEKVVEEAANLLECNVKQVPGRAKELFEKWKDAVKKKREVRSTELISLEEYGGDVLEKTAELLQTQPEHIIKTISRFLKELKEKK
ncbi:alanine--tRNA ligase [Candidatus Woesearchaeota archaeon]|nr:alanine--tRNA ligase [Candidatus Woesearchaeota archaeon]